MRRFLILAGAVLAAVTLAPPASAETPTEVLEQTRDDGVFIAPGVGAHDTEALAAVVAEARRIGLVMIIAAPADPVPTAEAFALRLRQAGDVDVALVFAPDGVIQASVTDDLAPREVPALDAARAAADPDQAAHEYLTTLVAERDDSLPGTVRRIILVVIVLVVLLVGVTVAEQFLRPESARGRGVTTGQAPERSA